jgi:hypothetical protein
MLCITFAVGSGRSGCEFFKKSGSGSAALPKIAYLVEGHGPQLLVLEPEHPPQHAPVPHLNAGEHDMSPHDILLFRGMAGSTYVTS